MNRKIILFLFLTFYLTCFICLHAQDTWVQSYNPYSLEWVEDYGWIELIVAYDVEDVLISQDGGYVVSGSFDRFIDDEPYYPWFDHWGFLMKTDSDGNLIWAKKDSVAFMEENYNYAFTETNEGDFITVGYAYAGGGYLMKRDSEGNELWTIPINDIGAQSMCSTDDGNIVLAGRANYNAALRKVATDGVTLWTSVIDLDNSIAYSVIQSSDGGYLLTGINYGNNDVLVIKTDTNGDSLWTRTYDVNNDDNRGNCIIEINDNDILCSGSDGFLRAFTDDGSTISSYFFENWNIRSCLQTIDNNFILFTGWTIIKINSYGDILSLNSIALGGSMGDRNIRELDNEGLICIGSYHSNIYLYKTDSEGNYTTSDNYEIPSIVNSLFNYPNPFNPETTISFELHENIENPIIEIFNIKGQKIRQYSILDNQNSFLRKSSIVWDGTDNYQNQVSSGVYLYRIKSDDFVSRTKKMLLLK